MFWPLNSRKVRCVFLVLASNSVPLHVVLIHFYSDYTFENGFVLQYFLCLSNTESTCAISVCLITSKSLINDCPISQHQVCQVLLWRVEFIPRHFHEVPLKGIESIEVCEVIHLESFVLIKTITGFL